MYIETYGIYSVKRRAVYTYRYIILSIPQSGLTRLFNDMPSCRWFELSTGVYYGTF
jgi:hypothetical protein